MDFLLPLWNPFIVHPLLAGLRAFAAPLETVMSPGLAGGLAIILFTIAIRTILVPLSLIQIKSQKAMMALQPKMKELQKKFKGDREGMARAQMALYKEHGVNPAAGCLPLVMQMPILFGMYSALLQLSTQGLTLDQVQAQNIQPGRVTYEAVRTAEPLPVTQFVLARMEVVPTSADPITLEVVPEETDAMYDGASLLTTTQGLTLTPGQSGPGVNVPGVPGGRASLILRPGGVLQPDGSLDRSVIVAVGQPYLVEVEVHSPQVRVDHARVTATFDPAVARVTSIKPPDLHDLGFKSRFLWLPSLGEPDLIHIAGLGIPGFLLVVMTITSFITQRMVTVTSEDPQQMAMQKTMAFMPLMYLFFFLGTPAGLVLYWLVSNVFSTLQQYFTTGLGLLANDLQRLTGRDYQPSWARVGLAPGGGTTSVHNGRVRNGRTDAPSEDQPETPTRGAQPSAGRGNRSAGSKGRKRGKR